MASSDNFESITEFSKSINVLDAIVWIADTWVEVSPELVTTLPQHVLWLIILHQTNKKA
jgi:hypothetical protein